MSKILNRKVIKFRAKNRDIFEAILDGRKQIETRAATERYRDLKAGDVVVLVCGKSREEKKIKKIEFFKSIAGILKKYKSEIINPNTHTAKEARDMYYSFPGYKEKIKKHGLLAMHL